MKFRKKQVGGFRPICTGSPSIGVVGGFNLNKEKVNYPIDAIIPSASLAEYDESSSRQVVVLKASRVVAIDATDTKKVSLQCDEFLSPIFMVGDHVARRIPVISKILQVLRKLLMTATGMLSCLIKQ